MGWFLRKGFKLGSGVRVNLSKKGLGISAGIPGARVSVGPGRNPRVYGGKGPLRYQKSISDGTALSSKNGKSRGCGCGAVILIIIIGFAVLSLCSKGPSPHHRPPAEYVDTPDATPIYSPPPPNVAPEDHDAVATHDNDVPDISESRRQEADPIPPPPFVYGGLSKVTEDPNSWMIQLLHPTSGQSRFTRIGNVFGGWEMLDATDEHLIIVKDGHQVRLILGEGIPEDTIRRTTSPPARTPSAESRHQPPTIHTPERTSDGRKIYTGPRGGRYYINAEGNKVYVSD
jgi:hypothetical protein